jgi:Rho GTPase-activating protein 1
MAKSIGTDHSPHQSPRQSPRQSAEATPQPAAPVASETAAPTSFAPPLPTSPPPQQVPIPPARPVGGRDRPQSMMVLPSQTSKPQVQPQPQQQTPSQQQQQEGWFSRFIGGLRNSSNASATKPPQQASTSSTPTAQQAQKPTTAHTADVSKAAASPGAPKPTNAQQQQALEREQKRTAQYNEYLKMAQGMDFTALKQHKIIYQSGVDFHGRSVVMLIGNIPKDVNWDMLFLYFLSILDPIVEREYVMVYVHLSESSRPQLAWMRKVYTLFQRKWKKNLKQLFIVYPTFWVKTIFRVFRPFVSNKFWSKLVYVDDPKKLYNYMNPTAVQLPEYAMTDALRAELKRYFGVPLDRLMSHPLNEGLEMPHIVEAACRALDTPRALEQEGIFRLSGTLSRMKELRGQYDRGVLVDLDKEPEVHAVAGLLKMWLRELPDPLIPYFLYDMFIDNFDKNDIQGSRLRVANLMISIPLFNLRILDKMLRLLNKISTYSSINKMTTTNLAIVFGPNLLRPEQESPEFALFHASIIPAIVKFMIESPDEMLGPAITLRTEAAAASAAVQTTLPSPEKVVAPVATPLSPRKEESADPDDGGLLSLGNRQFGFVRDRTKTMQQRRQIAQSLKTEPLTAEKIAEMQKEEDAAAASSSTETSSSGDPLGATTESSDLMQFSSQ